MKIKIIIMLFISIAYKGYAQQWSVDPASFQFNMNMMGVVSINEEIINDSSSQIAAFTNDTCRGVVSPTQWNGAWTHYPITLYSNMQNGDTMRFKVAVNGVIVDLDEFVIFENDKVICSPDEPFVWHDNAPYSASDILTFEVDSQTSATIIDTAELTINIEVPNAVNLQNLIPHFILSPGAEAFVNDTVQISAISAQNFLNPVNYYVYGVDGSIKNWEVTIVNEGNNVYEVFNRNIKVFPNPSTGFIKVNLGKMQAQSIVITDITGKTIINYQLSIDNSQFEMDLSGLHQGIYFLKVFTYQGVMIHKVIKE